jgi:hypothetical protein
MTEYPAAVTACRIDSSDATGWLGSFGLTDTVLEDISTSTLSVGSTVLTAVLIASTEAVSTGFRRVSFRVMS